MMKSLICALACSALLGACVTAPAGPPVVVAKAVEAKVEVATSCVTSVPQPDSDFLSDDALLTGTGRQVADKLWADHLERRDYIDKLVAALTGCVAPSGSPKLAGAALQ